MDYGQFLYNQKHVKKQIKQEVRQTRGCKPRGKNKGRRCDVCDKSGHNARSCQIDGEASSEEDINEN